MATTNEQPPTFRHESPSPESSPTPALGACPELSRCLSTSSSVSHGSSTDMASRDSLGSSLGSDTYSRQSSGSYGRPSDVSVASSRQSTCSVSSRRRGYVRPQGTDFAASAKSRESVLSLGSIAHLQYYFARTGLLDGKGGQVARKRQQRGTLDLSALDTSCLRPKIVGSDADSSYASMGSSPELAAHNFGVGPIVESPIEDPDEYYSDGFDEPDPSMLPPTASTYIHREKPVPRPPTIIELKSDLTSSLEAAAEAMEEVRSHKKGDPGLATDVSDQPQETSQGWFEIQGMHILDVMTLAIRAAKVYYTAHEQPERLDAIKPERELRTELFSVMESLKQMATRRFAGGMRDEEIRTMDAWVQGLFKMLKQEEDMDAAQQAERASWAWLGGDWTGREVERELAFLASLDSDAEPLPEFTKAEGAASLPTPFLASMQNGLRLIKLHNAAVKRSRRRFGAIPTFHTDTQKPYRCADNLRYWVKAAELRWEVMLKVDALGVVYNSGPQVWVDFEVAILAWCRKVREEIAGEFEG